MIKKIFQIVICLLVINVSAFSYWGNLINQFAYNYIYEYSGSRNSAYFDYSTDIDPNTSDCANYISQILQVSGCGMAETIDQINDGLDFNYYSTIIEYNSNWAGYRNTDAENGDGVHNYLVEIANVTANNSRNHDIVVNAKGLRNWLINDALISAYEGDEQNDYTGRCDLPPFSRTVLLCSATIFFAEQSFKLDRGFVAQG